MTVGERLGPTIAAAETERDKAAFKGASSDRDSLSLCARVLTIADGHSEVDGLHAECGDRGAGAPRRAHHRARRRAHGKAGARCADPPPLIDRQADTCCSLPPRALIDLRR